jgi:hypothetical protein
MSFVKKLLGRYVSVDDVLDVLYEIKISESQAREEKTVEKILLKELRKDFTTVHQQYNIGGYLGMKSDIDIGDGDVGIEIKLAASLNKSASNVQRLFGQAIYYKNRKYKKSVIALIVGSAALEDEPFMIEIMSFLEDIGVSVCYIATTKRRR